MIHQDRMPEPNSEIVRKLQQTIIAIAEFVEKDQPAAKQALAASYPELSAQEIEDPVERGGVSETGCVLLDEHLAHHPPRPEGLDEADVRRQVRNRDL